MKKIVNLFIVSLILFFLACGNEPPVISFPSYNVLIYQKGALGINKDSIYLSVFFIVEDENGTEDITKVRVTHIESELTWDIPMELLNEKYIWNEKNYTGYPYLEYKNGDSILTGDYLIEIQDTAGNLTETTFVVEVDGVMLNKEYRFPEIKYKIESSEKKEIKILNDRYNSCDIKNLTDNSYFNGGRKKFKENQKIILNNSPLPQNTVISVKINKDIDEKIIYILKDIPLM